MRRVLMGLCGLVTAGLSLQAAAAVSPPDPAVCPASTPVLDSGSTKIFPGHWHNPQRHGTGWDFYFTEGGSVLMGYWYTYDSVTRAPVWYMVTAPVIAGSDTWAGTLNKITLPQSGPNAGRVQATPIGSVAGRTYGGTATKMAVRWAIDGVMNNPPSECLYDLFRESKITAPQPGAVDPTYTGNWADPQHLGWGINLSVANLGSAIAETEKAVIYDAAGQPVWLMATAVGAPSSDTMSAPRLLLYRSSKYRVDQACEDNLNTPVNECVQVWDDTTRSHNAGTGACTAAFSDPGQLLRRLGHRFTSATEGQASLVVKVAARLCDGVTTLNNAAINWPGTVALPPSNTAQGNPATLAKQSGVTHVYVNSPVCMAPSAVASCNVLVSWASLTTGNRLYRVNGTSATLVSSVGAGTLTDALPVGSRVQYELRNSGGVALATSAEVVVTAPALDGGDSTLGPPDAAPGAAAMAEPSLDLASDTVGALAGEFKVDEGGNATYRIPLFTPPGRGGLAPPVALSYHSGAGEGRLGMGFSLEAAGAIQRCRSGTEFGDPAASSGQLDQLCLDGQRLLLVRGQAQQVGAEYRTEIESFQRVKIVQASPLVFTVEGKDGSLRRYGGSGGTLTGHNQGSVAVAWLQTEHRDASGNALTYTYASGNGERVLSTISYQGGSIDFAYRASGRYDISHSSAGDTVSSQLLTAVTVKGADGSVLRHYPVTYRDAFSELSGTLVRPRVQTIRECADTGETVCYPGTRFDWQEVSGNVDTGNTDAQGGKRFPNLRFHRLGDFDGDGRADIAWIDAGRRVSVTYSRPDSRGINFSPNTALVTLDGSGRGTLEVFDLDADGYDDIVYLTRGASGRLSWILRRSTGAGFAPEEVLLADVANGVANEMIVESSLVDHSGDGLPDLMFWAGLPQVALMEHVRTDVNRPLRFVAPIGVKFEDQFPYQSGCASALSMPRRDQERAQVVDVDGDGRADLAFQSTSVWCNSGTVIGAAEGPVDNSVPNGQDPEAGEQTPAGTPVHFYSVAYRVNGVISENGQNKLSFKRYGRTIRVAENMSETAHERARQRVMHADLNGDGVRDIVYLKDNGEWRSNLSVSGSTSGLDVKIENVNANHIDKVQLLDYDGDGRLDFWWPDASTPNRNYVVYLWRGDRFATQAIRTQFVATAGNDWMRLPADFDGDGMVDNLVIKPVQDSTSGDGGWQVYRSVNHHRPRGVVSTITNGLGAVTQLDYSPLTFRSVYSRDYDGVARPWGRGAVVFDLTLPNYVVHYVESSAPTWNNASERSAVQYSYAGLKVQAGGRGSLGFRRVSTIDLQTAVTVDTSYNQNFPWNGLPVHTGTRKLSQLPADVCRPGGALNDAAAGCFSHVAFCPSGRLQVCDASQPEPNAVMLKALVDVYAWRYQPLELSPAGVPAELNYSVESPMNAPVPAGLTPPIFIGRTVSNTNDYYDAGGVRGYTAFVGTQFGTSGYDDHGNVLYSKVTTRRRGIGGQTEDGTEVVLETRNRFLDTQDTQTWKLGRLQSTDTLTTRKTMRGGQATTTTLGRRASFGYTAKGLLASERVEGMLGASVDALTPDPGTRGVATYYDVNAAGNRVGTATCSLDIPEATCRALRAPSTSGYLFHPADRQVMRYARSTYDSLERFVNSTSGAISTGLDASAERTLTTVTARNSGGDVLEATDANGVSSSTRYGRLGRKRFGYSSTGAASRVDYARCTSANCPTGMALAYVMTTITAPPSALAQPSVPASAMTAPQQWTYFDLVGRPVLSVSQGLRAGDVVSVLTQYDDRGNVYRQSEPFFAQGLNAQAATPATGVTPAWTTTHYDALNRPERIVAPDGGQTSKVYTGSTVVTTLPANKNGQVQTLTEVRNAQGELVSTTDANGLVVEFLYDAGGNVVNTTRNGRETTASYDTLGRKKWTNDPDAGMWRYVTNDAGEVIEQTGPRGTCTRQRYDGNGRLWQRKDYSDANCTAEVASATWRFDTAAYGVGQLASEESSETGAISVVRNYSYNERGLVAQVATTQDNKTYVAQSTYDAAGRPFQSFFAAPGLPTVGEKTVYNERGYAYQVRSAYPAGSGALYNEVQELDARGQVKREQRLIGAAFLTERQYDARTGRLLQQKVQNGSLQQLNYTYDKLGNVDYRESVRPSGNSYETLRETFAYDKLQRLTGSTITRNGATTGTTGQLFDGVGNITQKNALAYTYGQLASVCSSVPGAATPGPHAVSQAGNTQYCYDRGGNVIRINSPSDNREFTYSAYDLVREVRSTTNGTHTGYDYGPGREKVRRRDYPNATATTANALTDYVAGAEVRWVNGAIDEVRRYAGGLLVIQRLQGGAYRVSYQYLLTDAQGSTDLVVDIWGQPVNANATMSFDAYGQRRDAADWNGATPWSWSLDADLDRTTRHGYTGHEQADEVGIVHMNGRIYDPMLGRFLQADPFVQAPGNSQSHNRYSYVFNNPMAYTDPTGYFGSKERGNVRTAAAIVISCFMPGMLTTYTSMGPTAAAVVTGAAAGAVQSGTARGAAMGAITAYAFSRVDAAFVTAADKAGGMTPSLFARKALTDGILGGVLATVNGGRFGHGFISAGLSNYLAPTSADFNDHPIGTSLAMAAAGGTLSAVSGGDFVNGALTGAFRAATGTLRAHGSKTGQSVDRALEQRMANAAYGDPDYWLAWELPSLPQGLVDFAAGMGDTASFGLSAHIRGLWDIDGGVDETSNSYRTGMVAGIPAATGTILAGGMAFNMGIRAVGGARTLYHFTSSAGAAGIAGDGVINASMGMAGRGVYAAALPTRWLTFGARGADVMLTIPTAGLRVGAGVWPGTFRIMGSVPFP
ncbi:RHS repeat-associated core domain-containing protein [Tahibacter amnicola]|uniref:Insecticide toxin TcdB middle/N-terminal domain-containing protein n=1 Tax=Tahibacter amnicola TaxID=2976241 RepID=A0ABY6BJE4_9GAMM|nr:RHS repeat-associated core domain-containing protein [Tahibacter amnicola]UXI70133.1 hypothetical protein N4264_11030 [Tahibacter amnicola]